MESPSRDIESNMSAELSKYEIQFNLGAHEDSFI